MYKNAINKNRKNFRKRNNVYVIFVTISNFRLLLFRYLIKFINLILFGYC